MEVSALLPVLSSVLSVHRNQKNIFQGNTEVSTSGLIFMQISINTGCSFFFCRMMKNRGVIC